LTTPCESKDDIIALKSTIVTHGQHWKMLMWSIGVFISVMLGFAGAMYKSQQVVSEAATKIDKTLSSYIAGAEQRNSNLERRIEQETRRIDDHEKRIRVLENKR